MTNKLGTSAYADSSTNKADLFKNLEGCNVHRFSPGTEEHAGTALMVTELPTNEGLGVQVSMDTDGEHIPIYPANESSTGWTIEETPVTSTLDKLERACPNLTIKEVVHHNIMDPDTARVVAILESPSDDPYALDIHIDDRGGTEFFEVPLNNTV